MEKKKIFAGTWQVEPRDADYSTGGRAAAREKGTADREGMVMSTRTKRTRRRFQVEALEARWTPGGCPGGVLGDAMCHIGEKIHQVHVAPATCGSNTVRAGEEGNGPVAFGAKPGIASGSN
jgi:hypothetical protein